MTKKDENERMSVNSTTVKLITFILGIATAYFLTIQSIKVDLAAKAEIQTVETLDKKLTNIEVMLKEGVVSKEQFYTFSKEIETRLSRIEFLLENKQGERLGKK